MAVLTDVIKNSCHHKQIPRRLSPGWGKQECHHCNKKLACLLLPCRLSPGWSKQEYCHCNKKLACLLLPRRLSPGWVKQEYCHCNKKLACLPLPRRLSPGWGKQEYSHCNKKLARILFNFCIIESERECYQQVATVAHRWQTEQTTDVRQTNIGNQLMYGL